MSDSNDTKEKDPENIVVTKPTDITVVTHSRELHMYFVSDSELDDLESGYNPVNLGLFTLCIGILIAFIVAILTATLSDKTFASFIAIIFVSFIMSVVFGFKVCREKKKREQRFNAIRDKNIQLPVREN